VRPYKPAFGHDDAVERIRADRGSHFDPDLVDCFVMIAAEFRDIRRQVDDRSSSAAGAAALGDPPDPP
jgi:putative two-component system response regulator